MTLDLRTATAAGVTWDAVRIPIEQGLLLFWRLVGQDLDRLGHVVLSEASRQTYWLIPTGSQPDAWPDGVRLLTVGSCVQLPHETVGRRSAWWLYNPDDDLRLTGATLLAAALHDQGGDHDQPVV
jgi:hypothetical protein